MHSCIYEGDVAHDRRTPVVHRFQYRLFMVYLDLDELPALVGPGRLISDARFAACSFCRSDHLDNPQQSLGDEVRQQISNQTGRPVNGPIRLLTQLRYFGYYMSPLNLFYALDATGQQVESIVAEVNNTPWKERHCYVLGDAQRRGDPAELRFAHAKDFHVSPFMEMAIEYRWRLSTPGDSLRVELANHTEQGELFRACLNLKRRELNRAQLRRMTVRYPLLTAQITAAIYYQALQLWWKKCPSYPHPKRPTSPALKAPDPTIRPLQASDPAFVAERSSTACRQCKSGS